MTDCFLVNLGSEQRHGYVVGGRLPEPDPAYSPLLDIGFSRQSYSWRDETPHLHTHSEKYFIVVRGRLNLVVNGHPPSHRRPGARGRLYALVKDHHASRARKSRRYSSNPRGHVSV
jgi:hypothetical protein